MRYKALLIFFVTSLSIPNVYAAPRVKIPNLQVCVQPSGNLLVKQKCGRGETAATLATITASGQAGAQGPQGVQGNAGPAGAKGEKGDVGPAGKNGIGSFEPVPSGLTVTGLMGDSTCVGTLLSPTLGREIFVSVKSSTNLPDENVVVKDTAAVVATCPDLTKCYTAEEISVLHKCTGTPNNPTAPPGVVCIYPTDFRGPQSLRAKGKGGYGFSVSWTGQLVSSSLSCGVFEAVWAYTAP